jgi:hypothetical protein
MFHLHAHSFVSQEVLEFRFRKPMLHAMQRMIFYSEFLRFLLSQEFQLCTDMLFTVLKRTFSWITV